MTEQLTEEQKAVLDFERLWWKHAGAKEAMILDQFAMTSVRYYQVLNALIDVPAALAYDSLTVKRLQRLRAARREQRSARARLG